MVAEFAELPDPAVALEVAKVRLALSFLAVRVSR